MKEPRLGPLVAVLIAAPYVGVVILTTEPWRWSGRDWLLIGLGTAIAAGAIAGAALLRRFLMRHDRPMRRVVFFAFGALMTFAAIPVVAPGSPILALGSFGMAAMFAYGSIGTLLHWPGFRQPRAPDECPGCGYNLTGNTSGVCPECGSPADVGDDDDV